MSAAGQQLFQNSYYVGSIFIGILYGVELMLFFQTMQRLRDRRSPRTVFLMFFNMVLLLINTAWVIVQCLLGEEMWVIHQDYPGGSPAFITSDIYARYQVAGTIAFVVLLGLSDAVLIYRCWTIWGGNWKVIIAPNLFWLASLVTGIFDLCKSHSADFYVDKAELYTGLVYNILCITLNVLTTSLICGRILYSWFTVHKRLGDEFSSAYFTVASVIVESALPYTLFSIAFLVALGMRSGFSVFPLFIYGMFACISPQMVLLRVAEGKAWNKNTANHVATMTTAFVGSDILDLPGSRAQDDAADQSELRSEESQSKSEKASAVPECLFTPDPSVSAA